MTRFQLREHLGLEDWVSPDGEHLVLFSRHPKHPEWAIRAAFEVYSDDVALTELHIYPVAEWAPPGGLTDEIRRSVQLGDLRRRARQRLTLLEAASALDVDPADFQRNKARGRKGRTDLDYARLAQRYVELLDSEAPVIQTLSDELKLSNGTVRGLVWEARRRGVLSPSPPGRAGGQLTDKGRRLLHGAS